LLGKRERRKSNQTNLQQINNTKKYKPEKTYFRTHNLATNKKTLIEIEQ
jgi:hypothetical protein